MTTRLGNSPARSVGSVDQGLRAYMLRVYDFVGLGLGVSAVTAYGVLAKLCALRSDGLAA